MIIYIDKTIASQKSGKPLDDSEIKLFEHLANSHKEGYSLLCGDIFSIEYLSSAVDVYFRPVFIQIMSKQPELRALIEKVSKVIVLSYKQEPEVPKFFSTISDIIIIKVNDAAKLAMHEQCALICENMNDCEFYSLIGERYRNDFAVGGIQISLRPDPGGGGTVFQMLEDRAIKQKNCALCIVDSDYKHGNNPPLGSTAAKVKSSKVAIKHKVPYAIFHIMVLDVHEAENLIPISVLENISNNIPTMEDGIKFMKALIRENLTDALKYYDLKNGDKKIKAPEKLTETDPLKKAKYDIAIKYWDNICDKLGINYIPALCSGLLEKAIAEIKRDEKSCSYIHRVVIDDYLITYWHNIGKEIFTWGCANKPTSTHSAK